ncbi:uncharacterized protein LOC133325814 [Musca vetustissima]|uniref:uncharacterized protein LOC133325814 n=1 Tax=Musca vetustissima TaxID=27455 RepID=UPI002AB604BC|nr:uncharacterized protein LOC133325814 [Musca vetustissima]
MKGNYIFHKVLFFAILLNLYNNIHCTPARNQERSLADPALADDIKWFFRGIGNFAGTVERMLPNIKSDPKNKTFGENAKFSLLTGLRHVLVGVREISMTFEQSLKTDHIKQLQQFKNAANFVNDIIGALKMWLSQLRALVVHIYTLYNRYLPEVLFGKCLGNYLVTNYPDRSYYEYPFILLAEIYESIVSTGESASLATTTEGVDSIATESTNIDDDLNIAQNEISHTDETNDYDNGVYSTKSRRNAEDASSSESIFNLSTVLNDDKDKIIENAAQQQSWKICLKLYTAESISRSLKSYFLNM